MAASTRVLGERRASVLSAADDVVLGTTFITLRGLAEHCAAETGAPLRRALDGAAFTRLVHHCAAESSGFGPLFAERPGLAGALAATLRDLRDAGVSPDALPSSASDVGEVYAATQAALDALAKQGALDRIGLFQLACRGAAA